MQVEPCGLGLLRWPRRVSMPRVRSALKSAGLPRWLVSLTVQVVAEKGSLNRFAEFARSFVSSERNEADAVSLAPGPFAVKPRACDDKSRMLRIVFFGVTKNLPRSPGIFLIPESRNVQVGHGGSVKLADPGFLF